MNLSIKEKDEQIATLQGELQQVKEKSSDLNTVSLSYANLKQQLNSDLTINAMFLLIIPSLKTQKCWKSYKTGMCQL